MLDSLVRVSRRVDWNHSANVLSAQVRKRPRRALRRASVGLAVPKGSPAGPTHVDQRPALGPAPRAARTKPGRTRCFQSLSPQQFQALFNSLFKVLFIFPSRYLFAIGLSPLFSLRWLVPPTLGCNPKQPDSSNATRGASTPTPSRGSHPLGRSVPGDLGDGADRGRVSRLQFAARGAEIFKLGSSRFTRRY